MSALTLHSRVVFSHPFEVLGLPGVQPAGAYSVEMRKSPWWRRLFLRARPAITSMRICLNKGLRGELHLLEICQTDLGKALHRDRRTTTEKCKAAQ